MDTLSLKMKMESCHSLRLSEHMIPQSRDQMSGDGEKPQGVQGEWSLSGEHSDLPRQLQTNSSLVQGGEKWIWAHLIDQRSDSCIL